MKVLLTNDDGPLSTQFSPYIRPFAQYIIKHRPDWDLTICVPHSQKSWIGKAHMAGKEMSLQFLYSKKDSNDDTFFGPYVEPQLAASINLFDKQIVNHEIPEDCIEWICVNDGTPASCVNIALEYLKGNGNDFDLVISGPNVGANASALAVSSSGTVGAAMEAVLCGEKKAIALSWGNLNPNLTIATNFLDVAAKKSVDIIEYLLKNWNTDTDLYNINIPLKDKLETESRIYFAPVWENRWTTIYSGPNINDIQKTNIEDGSEANRITFKWSLKAENIKKSRFCDQNQLCDYQIVHNGDISITPMRATFLSDSSQFGEVTI